MDEKCSFIGYSIKETYPKIVLFSYLWPVSPIESETDSGGPPGDQFEQHIFSGLEVVCVQQEAVCLWRPELEFHGRVLPGTPVPLPELGVRRPGALKDEGHIET